MSSLNHIIPSNKMERPHSQDSSSSYVPGTPPLPTMPSDFFGKHFNEANEPLEVPETPPKQRLCHSTSEQQHLSNGIPYIANDTHSTPYLKALLPTPDQDLEHSAHAKTYLGKRVPNNTMRSTDSSMKQFCRYTAERRCKTSVSTLSDDCECDAEEKFNHVTIFSLVRRLVFRNEEYGYLKFGYSEWTVTQLERVRFFLVEFVTNYVSSKTGAEVKPSTMKCYLSGIQRGFADRWGYVLHIFEGPVFNCPKNGLYAVVDNRFSEQQANGQVVVSHNTLSREDVSALFTSSALSRDTPIGFQARLVFGIALATAMRPSALATLTMKQFKKVVMGREQVWTISSLIGSRIGASKGRSGGLKAVKDKPTEICVWNKATMDGTFNLFEDIEDYLTIREKLECGTDRFFLAANPHARSKAQFFKRQHLGRNSFTRIIKDTCAALGIKGTGFSDGVTAHGLRGTVFSLLFETGSADASVALRTGHRDLRSLQSYHNLQGKLGQQQQDAIFGRETKKAKVSHVEGEKENDPSMPGLDDQASRDPASPTKALLTGVEAISGGSFTFNVYNYR